MSLRADSLGDRLVEIRRLGATDRVFAEICRDYDTLVHLMPRDTSDPVLEDIRDSLSGLEEEICAKLERSRNHTGRTE